MLAELKTYKSIKTRQSLEFKLQYTNSGGFPKGNSIFFSRWGCVRNFASEFRASVASHLDTRISIGCRTVQIWGLLTVKASNVYLTRILAKNVISLVYQSLLKY